MTICKSVVTDVIKVTENTSLYEVAELMKIYNVGSVVVVKDINVDLTPIGIITDRDLVIRFLAKQLESTGLLVKDILDTKDFLVLNKDADKLSAIKAMADKGVRRSPVVDDTGKVIGVVSVDDLLLWIIEELTFVADIIKKQKTKEKSEFSFWNILNIFK